MVSQAVRRRKRSKNPSVNGSIPSLGEFMHQQKVRHLYRSFMRCLHAMDDDSARADARSEIVQQFRQHQHDPLRVQMAVREGERRLAQLQAMVGYASPTATGDADDSWMNTQDPDDPRGRVGEEWPWERHEDNEDEKDNNETR